MRDRILNRAFLRRAAPLTQKLTVRIAQEIRNSRNIQGGMQPMYSSSADDYSRNFPSCCHAVSVGRFASQKRQPLMPYSVIANAAAEGLL